MRGAAGEGSSVGESYVFPRTRRCDRGWDHRESEEAAHCSAEIDISQAKKSCEAHIGCDRT